MPHSPLARPAPLLALLFVLSTGALSGCVVAGTTSSNGGSGGGFFFLLLPLLIFAFVGFTIRRSMRRPRSRERSAPPTRPDGANEQLIRAGLSVLADDALRLEPQVALHEAARNDYESAVHRYRVAQAAIEHATEQVDLVRVQRVVDEATWSMSRAAAIVQDRTPPPPPPWLQEPGLRGEPAVRMDSHDQPHYVGAPVSFRSGWFGGGGGLFSGLLFGSMLGGFGGWMVDDSDDSDDVVDADGRTDDGSGS